MSRRAWLQTWGSRIVSAVGAQAVVQGCNALSGLLAVWLLPRDSAYAWFTIATSMMVMLALLADCGVTTAVQSIGGPLCGNRARFSQAIRAVQRWRRRLTPAATLLVLPWMLVLLHRLALPFVGMIAAAILVAAFAGPSISAQIFSHVNRLHSRLHGQLLAEISGAGARLLLTVAGLALAWGLGGGTIAAAPVTGFVATLAAGCLPAFVLERMVRREAAQVLDPGVEATRRFDGRIRDLIAGTAAFTIYYGLQGQVGTWLISLKGTSGQVADVGALGRIGALFGLAAAPVVQLAAPAFARCAEPGQLRRQLLLTGAWFAAFAAGLWLLAALVPGPILWLLGPSYGHLRTELQLAVLAPALAGLCGIAWALVMARGWVRFSSLVVPVGFAAQLVGVCVIDLSTVAGVLLFNLVILIPVLLLACWIIGRNFRKQKSKSENSK